MEEKALIFSKPLGNESVVTKIVNQITDKIIAGDLKPGDKLPTEPDLCAALQVGRNSVREAIKILEAYGIVYIKRAEGTFINNTYTQKMLDPMLYGILLQKNFSSDIIQLRKVLDIGILHTVMQTITPDQLNALEKQLEALHALLASDKPDAEAIFQADVDFHMSIASASGNQLLLSMYSYVDRITAPSRENALHMILNSRESEEFIALHQKILDILKKKDFPDIVSVLTSHYKFWRQVV